MIMLNIFVNIYQLLIIEQKGNKPKINNHSVAMVTTLLLSRMGKNEALLQQVLVKV